MGRIVFVVSHFTNATVISRSPVTGDINYFLQSAELECIPSRSSPAPAENAVITSYLPGRYSSGLFFPATTICVKRSADPAPERSFRRSGT